jgi:hypothetical protein
MKQRSRTGRAARRPRAARHTSQPWGTAGASPPQRWLLKLQGDLPPLARPLCHLTPAVTSGATIRESIASGRPAASRGLMLSAEEAAGWGVGLARRLLSKQDRHSTGRPWVGRKGTVVSCPQTEQWVRVSARTLEPPPRFSLQALQRLGSLWNCLSWKNNCSPAVKMKSFPQSTHRSTLSWNSMTRSVAGPSCAPATSHPPRKDLPTYVAQPLQRL